MMHWVRSGSLRVAYTPSTDGGGDDFGQEFLRIVPWTLGRVESLCEFGCGPGFIGFSLLAQGWCQRLTLIDVNPEALALCQQTIWANRLQSRVRILCSDGLRHVSPGMCWEAVVSNPPHWDGTETQYQGYQRYYDPGWRIHRAFYARVRTHLVPGGSVLFQEHGQASRPALFQQMIEAGGLAIRQILRARPLRPWDILSRPKPFLTNLRDLRRLTRPSPLYFLWSQPR